MASEAASNDRKLSFNESNELLFKRLSRNFSGADFDELKNMPADYSERGYSVDPAEMIVVFTKYASDDFLQVFIAELQNVGLICKILPRHPTNWPQNKNAKIGDIIKIRGSNYTLSVMAEELKLRKFTSDGKLATFSRNQMHKFVVTKDGKIQNLFKQSEQLVIIEYVLTILSANPSYFDDTIPGESLIAWSKRNGYVNTYFPSHDKSKTDRITKDFTWKKPLQSDGVLGEVRDYYGDKVALYFSFLNSYTRYTIQLGLIGIFMYIFSFMGVKIWSYTAFVHVFLLTWLGISFHKRWAKKNATLSFEWSHYLAGDTIDEKLLKIVAQEDTRPTFKGSVVIDPITGRKSLHYSKIKRIRRAMLSWTVVTIFIVGSLYLLKYFLDMEDRNIKWVDDVALESKAVAFLPVNLALKNVWLVLYLVSLNILNAIYTPIAKMLTRFENHKYQVDFDNHLIAKLFVFFFISINASYLHAAFIRQEFPRVAKGIRNVLFIELVIGNIKELVVPYLMRLFVEKKRKVRLENEHVDVKDIDPEVENAMQQYDLQATNPEDDVFEDYFELCRQYTQITIFATAYPLGAFFAVLNNLFESYSDIIKWCTQKRRAFPRRALVIGSWIYCFETVNYLSIITNLGIIVYTAKIGTPVLGYPQGSVMELFMMIFIEHILLILRTVYNIVIHEIPKKVQLQVRKARYSDNFRIDGLQEDDQEMDDDDAPLLQASTRSLGTNQTQWQVNLKIPVLDDLKHSNASTTSSSTASHQPQPEDGTVKREITSFVNQGRQLITKFSGSLLSARTPLAPGGLFNINEPKSDQNSNTTNIATMDDNKEAIERTIESSQDLAPSLICKMTGIFEGDDDDKEELLNDKTTKQTILQDVQDLAQATEEEEEEEEEEDEDEREEEDEGESEEEDVEEDQEEVQVEDQGEQEHDEKYEYEEMEYEETDHEEEEEDDDDDEAPKTDVPESQRKFLSAMSKFQ